MIAIKVSEGSTVVRTPSSPYAIASALIDPVGETSVWACEPGAPAQLLPQLARTSDGVVFIAWFYAEVDEQECWGF